MNKMKERGYGMGTHDVWHEYNVKKKEEEYIQTKWKNGNCTNNYGIIVPSHPAG